MDNYRRPQISLPARAEVVLTARYEDQEQHTRNVIRFRNYNKFGSELRILDDDDQIEDKSETKKN
jgi:hypothetical protein